MIAQIGLTVLLIWVIAYAWAEYRRAPLIGTMAVLVGNRLCNAFRGTVGRGIR